ncbi:MAG: S-methyl-5'-thioinosine phosphorylase [Nevskia sp.]|jgi:5'-methylthioinosine phosphorylase|nr:S-methyl-5'-thioinosine phosphorylase [Nevskia sp.]MCK9383454.1 S-methyl-5'-thioinosine phosphorylase [Nevskia sp.]
MSTIAVIGGTGMDAWPGLEVKRRLEVPTPYGNTSAPLLQGRIYDCDAIFLARHGEGHKIPPHSINYRANLWALREVGVTHVIGIGAVGAIARWFEPGALAVPSDIIDYTWGRAHTYSDGGAGSQLQHIEFNAPYAASVRSVLLESAQLAGLSAHDGGVHGVTQGPRLESPAEVRRMRQDGCDMIGMTGMPEAALAAELELAYGCLAVSVNWAAGIGSGDIHGEIHRSIEIGMSRVRSVLERALPALIGGLQVVE